MTLAFDSHHRFHKLEAAQFVTLGFSGINSVGEASEKTEVMGYSWTRGKKERQLRAILSSCGVWCADDLGSESQRGIL